MSSVGMVWARAQKAGSPGAKALLLLLGELANDQAETYRDQTFIADILEVSRETVSRNLKVLADAKLITLEKQFDKAGQRRPNLIKLHVTNQHMDEVDEDLPCDDSSHSPCDDSSQQYKHSLNKQTSTPNGVEEAPAPPGPVQGELIEAPKKPTKSQPTHAPEWQVALWVSQQTNGAWTKHMLAPRVRWMIRERGMSQRDAALLLRDMWRDSRMSPTQANIGRIIDGLMPVNGQTARTTSTTDDRVNAVLALANTTPSDDPFRLELTS